MSLVDIEKTHVIDYDRFPVDAKPLVRWGRDPSNTLSSRARILRNLSVFGPILMACVMHATLEINDRWTASVFAVGLLLTLVLAVLVVSHYIVRLSIEPAMMAHLVIGASLNRRFPEEDEIPYTRWFAHPLNRLFGDRIVWTKTVLVFLAALAVLAHLSLGVPSAIRLAPLVLLGAFVLANTLIRRLPRLPSRPKTSHVRRALNYWFEPDYPATVPYRFVSPAGSVAARVGFTAVTVFFLALTAPRIVFFGPAVPAAMTAKAYDAMVLATPLWQDNILTASDREDLEKQTRGRSLNQILHEPVDEKRDGESASQHIDRRYAQHLAKNQMRIVSTTPTGWLAASWVVSSQYPALMFLAWLVSAISVLAVVLTPLFLALCFVMRACDFDAACEFHDRCIADLSPQWALESLWKYSDDRYEKDSVFLGWLDE